VLSPAEEDVLRAILADDHNPTGEHEPG
jgi:hypothetical protein